MDYGKIRLVDYTKGEEIVNCLSHTLGLALSGLIVWRCVVPAVRLHNVFSTVCAVLYLFGITAMFTASAVYHGLKPGKMKKILRVTDHCMIFFAVAGTATGCVPAVLATAGHIPAVLMLSAAWLGACGGLMLTLTAFEKQKAAQMAIYIVTAFVCAVCGAKAYFELPIGAFLAFLGGSTLLIVGLIIYGLGRKRRYFHSVFHFFILGGLFVYWLGIAEYCY